MDISEFISIEEAAKKLDYEKSSITLLCRQGKLNGAIKIGGRWLVPRETIDNYVKAPQGFAAIWQRRREAEKKEAENYFLGGENSDSPENVERNENASGKKNIELEILRCLKILIKEVRKLERTVAQAKCSV